MVKFLLLFITRLPLFNPDALRPLQNAPFCPIPASGSNFNPQNTQSIPVVKIIAFLGLEQNWTFFKGLTVSLIKKWGVAKVCLRTRFR